MAWPPGTDDEHRGPVAAGRPARFPARWLRRGSRQQQVEQPLLRPPLGLRVHFVLPLSAHHGDRRVHEVTHHGLDVAPDIAHLGELRSFHLDEWGARQARQAPGDLGLPDAGRPDKDDVVGRDLVPDLLGSLRPPPAIPHRDGHRLLRGVLPDDVPVQFGDDLPRGQFLEPGHWLLGGCRKLWVGLRGDVGHTGSSSTVMLRLVNTQMSAAISSERCTMSRAVAAESACSARAAASA